MAIQHNKSVKKCISKEYQSLSLDVRKEDTWVLDTRNMNLIGPFRNVAEGREMQTKLHKMLQENGIKTDPFTLHTFDGTLIKNDHPVYGSYNMDAETDFKKGLDR